MTGRKTGEMPGSGNSWLSCLELWKGSFPFHWMDLGEGRPIPATAETSIDVLADNVALKCHFLYDTRSYFCKLCVMYFLFKSKRFSLLYQYYMFSVDN